MKVILLLAGIGKRLGEITANRHKSLIELNGAPLIHHLGKRLIDAGLKNWVVVLGHDEKNLLASIQSKFSTQINLEVAKNPRYRETNNLFSIQQAKDFLLDQDFVLVNGDLVLDKNILHSLRKFEHRSGIVLDDSPKASPIDSPGTLIENGRILDLGRHIPFESNRGYAIGVYLFNRALGKAYFDRTDQILQAGQLQAGFHDPLRDLYRDFKVEPISTEGRLWTDIDVKEDIPYAEKMLRAIEERELNAV